MAVPPVITNFYTEGAFDFEDPPGSSEPAEVSPSSTTKDEGWSEPVAPCSAAVTLGGELTQDYLNHEGDNCTLFPRTAGLANQLNTDGTDHLGDLLATTEDSRTKILAKNHRVVRDFEAVKRKLKSQRTENDILKRRLEYYKNEEQSTPLAENSTPAPAPGKKARRKRAKKSPKSTPFPSPLGSNPEEVDHMDIDAVGLIVDGDVNSFQSNIWGPSHVEELNSKEIIMKLASLESQQREIMESIHQAMNSIEQDLAIHDPKDFVTWSIAKIHSLQSDNVALAENFRKQKEEYLETTKEKVSREIKDLKDRNFAQQNANNNTSAEKLESYQQRVQELERKIFTLHEDLSQEGIR